MTDFIWFTTSAFNLFSENMKNSITPFNSPFSICATARLVLTPYSIASYLLENLVGSSTYTLGLHS